MITGTWRLTPGIGDSIPLTLTDYYYSWFIIETIKSIVYAGNDYNNLTQYYNGEEDDCSSVTYLDVLVESMMEMYYACHQSVPLTLQTLLDTPSETGEEEESIPTAILNQHLGDLHYELFNELSANNPYPEFQYIVGEIGGVDAGDYDVSINFFGSTLHYVVRKSATKALLDTLW